MLDAYLELADYEVPVNIYPCPIVGLTSPASLFSTVCLINAEVLSGLVIFQLVKPGTAAHVRFLLRDGGSEDGGLRGQGGERADQHGFQGDGQILSSAVGTFPAAARRRRYPST